MLRIFVSCFAFYTVLCVCLVLCVGSTSPILSPDQVCVPSLNTVVVVNFVVGKLLRYSQMKYDCKYQIHFSILF